MCACNYKASTCQRTLLLSLDNRSTSPITQQANGTMQQFKGELLSAFRLLRSPLWFCPAVIEQRFVLDLCEHCGFLRTSTRFETHSKINTRFETRVSICICFLICTILTMHFAPCIKRRRHQTRALTYKANYYSARTTNHTENTLCWRMCI